MTYDPRIVSNLAINPSLAALITTNLKSGLTSSRAQRRDVFLSILNYLGILLYMFTLNYFCKALE